MYVPPRQELASDLAPLIGRTAGWITDRTGVAVRHVADESMASMAARVGHEVLGDERPDLILNASLTPIQLIPDSSVFVQQALGFEGIPSYTVHATCLSFAVGLQSAGALIQAGAYRRILLVSSEQGTPWRDLTEPESAALIGDGAAAALLEPAVDGDDTGLLGFAMGTWPDGADYAEFRGCGTRQRPEDPTTRPEHYKFRMRGPRVWRLALRHADAILDRAFAEAGMSRDAIDVIVPHQASGPMLDLFPQFGFDDRKVVKIIADTGNCIAASLPMALHTAIATERLRRGQTALLFGTGAGLSMAAAIVRY
ncbi:MAG: ketoacyl-ACP synthase III [Myxococcota bacterium]